MVNRYVDPLFLPIDHPVNRCEEWMVFVLCIQHCSTNKSVPDRNPIDQFVDPINDYFTKHCAEENQCQVCRWR